MATSFTRGAVVVASATTTVLAGLINAPLAGAHAEVRSTWPAANTMLTAAPTFARVTFGEEVTGLPGKCLRLLNAAGEVLSRTTVCTGHTVSAVPLRPLARGRYVLAYDVTSVDGHPVRAATAFSVGLRTPEATPRTVMLRGGTIRLSGLRVGVRTLRIAGLRGIGTVTWQRSDLDVPLTWAVRDGRAAGMLPYPGSYTVTVSVWESAWESRVLSGSVRITR